MDIGLGVFQSYFLVRGDFLLELLLENRGAQIFQKCNSDLSILGVRRGTWGMFYTKDATPRY